ncbi:Glutathione S-transferase GST-6.0 [Candidatus Methylobacter favarea]|uniref:Glutathione S-transferase GST-6.0 n=1 Tax=Candidatus Methylobacter favarea TaxID=2707345 RepID=A0A8S0XRC3_9GAMM|nr:glutathione transferase GstA [Candidatus Methylobacter favarea]CAA9889899.1 Glutathione S-transferase GST-6.0 [Candidatus Methylobacter favarea]
MKLYYSPGACSLCPHIVAKEAGLPLELVKVDLQGKHTETGEDFRQINPNGYVPVLILDNGRKLIEVAAIVQYLADLAPDKKIAPPAGSFERYQLQQWLSFISTEIHKSFSALFKPATPEAAKQQAIESLAARLVTVSEHLSTQTFLLGEQFSAADAYLFVTLRWSPYLKFDLSRWPLLISYADKISGRPAVQQALQEEGLASAPPEKVFKVNF